MKKWMSVILIICVLLSCIACGAGKNAQVKAVENRISDIGDVTYDSGADIRNALLSYNALTDEDKASVDEELVTELNEAVEMYGRIRIAGEWDVIEINMDGEVHRDDYLTQNISITFANDSTGELSIGTEGASFMWTFEQDEWDEDHIPFKIYIFEELVDAEIITDPSSSDYNCLITTVLDYPTVLEK